MIVNGILRFLNCGGRPGGGGGGGRGRGEDSKLIAWKEYSMGSRSPAPIGDVSVLSLKTTSIMVNVTCTICKHSTDAYPPLL